MKIKVIQILFYLVLPFLTLVGVAFASGKHLGGHGHGDEAAAIGQPGIPAMVDEQCTSIWTMRCAISPITSPSNRGKP